MAQPSNRDFDLLDDVLVFLARDGSARAQSELLLRYRAKIHQVIAHCRRSLALGPEDVKDAHQEAFFWLTVAVKDYDPGKGAAFGTFLERVINARLSNFARGLRRRQKHLGKTLKAEAVLDKDETRSIAPAAPRDELDDPAKAVEWNEMQELLAQALAKLPEAERNLWEEIRSGKSLRQLASDTKVPYGRVRRQWRQFLKDVAALMPKIKP
jgi:RNA polymerase sigma factor (sigma-70 family)